MCIVSIGTHDILNATTTETDNDAIVITTLYSEHSDARGALFDFVFIDDNGDVDFTRSVLLALDIGILPFTTHCLLTCILDSIGYLFTTLRVMEHCPMVLATLQSLVNSCCQMEIIVKV